MSAAPSLLRAVDREHNPAPPRGFRPAVGCIDPKALAEHVGDHETADRGDRAVRKGVGNNEPVVGVDQREFHNNSLARSVVLASMSPKLVLRSSNVHQRDTAAVSAAEAPKSFAELADPKWKSKIAITDPARSAIGLLMLKAMVAERGWEWVEQLMKNDPLVLAVAPGITQALVPEKEFWGPVSRRMSRTR